MIATRILAGLMMAALVTGAVEARDAPVFRNMQETAMRAVELRGLNKVTARSEMLRGNLGNIIRFGTLEIRVRTCWSAPPHVQPEHAALMEIIEIRPDEGPKLLFHGWMFASSPALSALEHAVYDIGVIRCLENAIKEEAE